MERKTSTRLAELLKQRELLVIYGGFSPLHARMCERLGFDAFFMSGSQVGAYLYAVPDVGLLSMRDMAEAVRRLASGSDIPIFADADTGYGNAINVRHTVQEYVRAGAAGLHIEDQEFPKRSGTAAGRRCIPVDEAVGKYGRRRRRASSTRTSWSAPAATSSAPRVVVSKMRYSAGSLT